MNILIRVDGGENIGFGHIMRCLTLANKLKIENKVKFVCSNDKEFTSGVKKIEFSGFEVVLIEKQYKPCEILDLNGEVLIIDKYGIDDEYLKTLNKKFKLVYIDDNNELNSYPAHFIINQNMYAKEFKYETNAELLLGSSFFMLRDEFLKYHPIKVNGEIKDVLITVGGSDDSNLTYEILQNLINLKEFNFYVVIGGAFKYGDMLKTTFNPIENIKLYENANMCEIMSKVDIAIAACGGTIYELCYMGVPTIGISVCENQERNYNYLKNKNIIIGSSINDLCKDIRKLDFEKRCMMSEKIKKVIDGLGTDRICNFITCYK